MQKLSVFILFSCLLMPSLSNAEDDWLAGLDGSTIQVMMGASSFDEDDMSFDQVSSVDPALEAESDLSTMIFLGVARQMPLKGERFQAGLESGFDLGWGHDKDSSREGPLYVSITNDLFTADIYAGGYLSAKLGGRARAYVGAGPILMYGWMHQKTKDRDESDPGFNREKDHRKHGFGAGVYARTGVDILIQDQMMVGFGVRALSASLDFGSDIDDADLNGPQFYVTWAVGF
jgi:hypothetical protein